MLYKIMGGGLCSYCIQPLEGDKDDLDSLLRTFPVICQSVVTWKGFGDNAKIGIFGCHGEVLLVHQSLLWKEGLEGGAGVQQNGRGLVQVFTVYYLQSSDLNLLLC